MPPLETFMFYRTAFLPNLCETKASPKVHRNIMLIHLTNFLQRIHYARKLLLKSQLLHEIIPFIE